MQSRRLPGKVLMPVAGRPLLQLVVERVRLAGSLDTIVVASGDVPANRPIAELARAIGVRCFLGSEEDVLDRFVAAAAGSAADVVVRVTADNPLTDPAVIDALVDRLGTTNGDLVVTRDLIDGAESEATTFAALQRAARVAETPMDREHVTLVMKTKRELFSVVHWPAPAELRRPDLSVTVDTQADLEKLQAVCESLKDQAPLFSWREVIGWLDRQKASVS